MATIPRDSPSGIGRRNGRKSRRTVDSETARNRGRIRDAQLAYRRFHALCFWSYRPELTIGPADVGWVAETLMKHGNREAWQIGRSLCR